MKFEGCIMNLFFLSHRGNSQSCGRVVWEADWLGFHYGTLSGGKEKKEWNSGDKIRQRVSGRKAQECLYPFMPHTFCWDFLLSCFPQIANTWWAPYLVVVNFINFPQQPCKEDNIIVSMLSIWKLMLNQVSSVLKVPGDPRSNPVLFWSQSLVSWVWGPELGAG